MAPGLGTFPSQKEDRVMSGYEVFKWVARGFARIPTLGAATINALYYASWGGDDRLMPIVFGVTFFAVDCAKPELARYAISKGRSVSGVISGLGTVVVVCVSLVAAVSHFAGDRAERIGRSELARVDLARAEMALAVLPEIMAVSDLETLHREAEAKAEREEARGGCYKLCETAKADASNLLERLSQARARDEALSQVSVARSSLTDREQVVMSLARKTGIEPEIAMLLLCLLAALALEISSTLVPFLVDQSIIPASSAEQSVPAVQIAPKIKLNREQAFADYAGELAAGRTYTSQNWAERWSCAPGTVSKWMRLWRNSGATPRRVGKLRAVG
jgi:hypothetical protein